MALITKLSISLSFALLAVLSAATPTPDGLSPFCITAEDKALCTQMVKGAKAWTDAMINVIEASLEKAKAGKSTANTIGSKLPANLMPVTKQSIDESCQEAYDSIIDNLKKSVEFVKNDPTAALKTHLSAISFIDCTMGMDEFGVAMPQEVDQFQNEMLKLTGVLLAVANEKH